MLMMGEHGLLFITVRPLPPANLFPSAGTPSASPNQKHYDQTWESCTLTPSATEHAFSIKLFCDGNQDGAKQEWEPYLMDETEKKVWEIYVHIIKVDSVSLIPEVACVGDSIFLSAVSDPPNSFPSGCPSWNSGLDVGTFDPATGASTEYTQNYPSEDVGDVTLSAVCGSSSASRDVTFVELTTIAATGNNGNQSLAVGFLLEPTAQELGTTPTATSDNDNIAVSSVGPDSLILSIGDNTAYNDAGNRNALDGGTITISAGPCMGTSDVTVSDAAPWILSDTIPGTVYPVKTDIAVTVADLEDAATASLSIDKTLFLAIVNNILNSYEYAVPLTFYPSVEEGAGTFPNADGSFTKYAEITYPLELNAFFELVEVFNPDIPGFSFDLEVTPEAGSGPDGATVVYEVDMNTL